MQSGPLYPHKYFVVPALDDKTFIREVLIELRLYSFLFMHIDVQQPDRNDIIKPCQYWEFAHAQYSRQGEKYRDTLKREL